MHIASFSLYNVIHNVSELQYSALIIQFIEYRVHWLKVTFSYYSGDIYQFESSHATWKK